MSQKQKMRNSAVIIILLGISLSASAQKFGFINSREVLASLPEVGKADTVLGIYQKQLANQGDSLGKAFDGEYKVFLQAYNAGTLSALETEKRKADLKNKQSILQKYAQDAQEKLATLRKQLLQPILARLDKAISDIGKTEKYDMIFDSGNGEALFLDAGADISAQLKKVMATAK